MNPFNEKLRYYIMSLLDENITTIIGIEPKRHWKEYFRGITQSLDLKDQHGTNLGKILENEKENNAFTLYNSDGSILLQFYTHGIFSLNLQILDSENKILGRTYSKMGLTSDKIWMENSEGSKILEGKSAFTVSILDQNEKPVAELKLKRRNKNFTLHIINSDFSKLMILGFSLALVIIQRLGGGGPESTGG